MTYIKWAGKFVVVFITLFSLPINSHKAFAVEDSLTLFIGEAYFPSHLRFSHGNFDIGISLAGMNIYAGGKVVKGSVYTGIGLGYGPYGVGAYAMLGYRKLLAGWVSFNAEFYGIGTANAAIMAGGLLGVGTVW